MVPFKCLPVSKKTFDVCWSLRRFQFSTEVDKQVLPNESTVAEVESSPNTKSVPQKFEIINPIKMAYTEYKSPELESNAPPLIIMDGLLGSRTNWKSLAKAIHAQTKLTVYTVDARNHGESEHSAEMTYAHLVEDVRRFMHDLKIPCAALLGHSMGGRAVMSVALQYPELVSRLVVVEMSPVVVSPTIHLMPHYFDAMDLVSLPDDMSAADGRVAANAQLRTSVKDAGVRDFILMNLVKGDDGRFKWRVNLGGIARAFTKIAIFPAGEEGNTYTGPTLFVAGGYSDHIPLDSYEGTRELFPAAKFEIIKAAGHWVHAEKPNEFLATVTPFLGPSPGGSQP